MAAGLALVKLYGLDMSPLALARIGQMAEHHFAGVNAACSTRYQPLRQGERAGRNRLPLADGQTVVWFRRLPAAVQHTSKHALVDGEYNQRRAACESATAHFAKNCRSRQGVRDVSWPVQRPQARFVESRGESRRASDRENERCPRRAPPRCRRHGGFGS